MKRLTFEGNFCDIAMCRENPCPYNGSCSQKETWLRLKEYEDREEQGCEFCREDSEGYYKMLGSFSISNPFHKGEHYLNGGKLKPRKINFCPMCGRKLGGAVG